MPIVSSAIARQLDLGASWLVDEAHTDNVGVVHHWRYTPTKAVDLNAKLAEHAASVAERIADEEVLDCIRRNVLTTKYLTKSEMAARIRELYRDGNMDTVLRIARWIRSRIQAGDFTETQVRNAFGLNQSQWDALKVKLQSYDEALAMTETAKGE